MTFEVEYRRESRVFFHEPLMSSEIDGVPVTLTQHINGSLLLLTVGARRFSVNLEQLAVAWIADVQNTID